MSKLTACPSFLNRPGFQSEKRVLLQREPNPRRKCPGVSLPVFSIQRAEPAGFLLTLELGRAKAHMRLCEAMGRRRSAEVTLFSRRWGHGGSREAESQGQPAADAELPALRGSGTAVPPAATFLLPSLSQLSQSRSCVPLTSMPRGGPPTAGP